MFSRILLITALAGGTPLLAAPVTSDPRNADDNDVEAVVLLQRWVPAEYPRDALKEKVEGIVKVRFIADARGNVLSTRVVETPDPRLATAAVNAIKQWQIDPLLEEGRAIACCLDAEIRFSPGDKRSDIARQSAETPRLAPTTAASPLETPQGDYPDVMWKLKLSGKVFFKGTVTETGDVVANTIIAASHSAFVLPALRSLERWKFRPKTQGDLALSADVEGAVEFSAEEASPSDILVANGISMPDGAAPELPAIVILACEAVWPIDAILAGEDGRATVEFTVTPNGAVKDVVVVATSHHDLGRSLTAAMETWIFGPQPDMMDQFSPRPRGSALTETRLRRTLEFTVPTDDGATASREMARLVAALRAGEIQNAKGLDQKLTPIYRAVPRYPGAFVGREAPAGQAIIDAVIDREGRVRLPRIISATQPDFGWAAATAAAQWVFKAPTRDGAPTDVKVRIPFEFKPGAE